ncbi:MAG: hypothetical protein WC595_05495 [Candidatus Nanoarchaeia archaeon]
MKKFEEFIKDGKVVKMTPDYQQANSLFSNAKKRYEDLKSLPLNEENAPFRFESAYEVIREAIQSFLSVEGYKPYSHEAIFAFALEQKLLDQFQSYQMDRYREIRNDINYRGERATIEEAKEIILFVKNILLFLEKKR